MQITLFSLFVSVVWSGVLAMFNHFCRKNRVFIRQLGMTDLLCLYLFPALRMILPCEFSFTRVIPSPKVFDDIYIGIYANKAGTTQITIWSLLLVVWSVVSAVLLFRFVCQYLKAMRKFLTYRIREDEQCRRVFGRVLNKSKRQVKIEIRQSRCIQIPMGAGIFRRLILLPEKEYSDSQLYYILRHEYTHFQNRDLAVKIFMHIYWCIFWWNPMIYFIKKDLERILEIKCDLDVTNHMDNRDKAEYLTTIVAMLKNDGVKEQEKTFYVTTAFVSKSCGAEIVERFRIVSAGCESGRRKRLFAGGWFLIFAMLTLASYAFVVRPDYEVTKDAAADSRNLETDEGYRIECVDGTYYVHFSEMK